MNTKNKESGFATRLLHGAKDLIWQDEAVANRSTYATDSKRASQAAGLNDQRADSAAAIASTRNPMADDLLAVVMNRPTAYSSLAEAIAALSDISMDDATRYRSAFAVLKKTQQRTVDQIAQAIDVHLGLLESEIVRFSSQSKATEEAEIAARIKAVDLLNGEVAQRNSEITAIRTETEDRVRQLQDEIVQKQSRAIELASEVEKKKQAIVHTTKNFEEATETVKARLNREKERIQEFLGAVSN